MRPRAALTTVLACAAAVAGCRTDFVVGGRVDGAPSALRIDPAEVLVTIQNGSAATARFRAIATVDGREHEVTAAAGWASDNPLLANVDAGGTAITGTRFGGETTIRAGFHGATAAARLRVRYVLLDGVSVDGAAPLPPAPSRTFGGATDDARAPELVYPNDGVLLPPNLFEIEVHFRPGPTANTLFEVGFANELTDVRAYTRCAPVGDAIDAGCLYAPTREAWTGLAETNRGGPPLTLTVRATDDAGAAVGRSAAHALRFAPADVRGALYYWTTSQGSAVMRWNFGDGSRRAAERFAGPEASGNDAVFCVGCHALSRDGGRMVLGTSMRKESGGNLDGALLLFDVARRTPTVTFPLAQLSTFESWSPDGSAFVGVFGDGGEKDLILFDGDSGARIGTIPLGGLQADHPDWSLDGNRIAFTSVGVPHIDQAPERGGITYVERGAGGTWSPPLALVPDAAGKNRYYPAIAPDGSFVVYDESTCPPGKTYDAVCNGDTDPSARLFAAPFPGAGTPAAPVELARANAPGVADRGAADLGTSYPKWSPYAFQASADSTIMWLTFSSLRRYGLRPSPAPASTHEGLPNGQLIWMVAVDRAALARGEDPSFPAFCLPFQDIGTSNHIAQWTGGFATVE